MKKMEGDSWALFGIKIAVESHQQSRFTLAQKLVEGHALFNRWKRRPLSMSAFITLISYIFPAKSKRSYQRHYRVWDKLIVQTGLRQNMLMDFDFSTLSVAAENRYLGPLTLMRIIPKLHAKLMNGESQKNVRMEIEKYAEKQRVVLPRLVNRIREQDEWIKTILLEQEEK